MTSFLLIPIAQTAAPVATSGMHDNSATTFLLQILVILLVGRLLGQLMHRLGQPAVMGQLIAGILLGPSCLGYLAPDIQHAIFPPNPGQKKMLDAMSQFGILLLLLVTGMETDLALVMRMRRTAFFSSLGGIVLPFASGFVLGQLLPEALLPSSSARLLTSLFLATALSISSVKIVASVLIEVDFLRRRLGQIILASAILDDTIGWILIGLIGGIAESGSFKWSSVGFSLLGTGLFIVLSFTLGRRAIAFLIRWTNDNFTVEMPVITAILVVMCGMALITDYIGVHTVLGAFVAGILIGQSPILTRHIEEQLKGLVVAFFMPIFFAVAGLSIDLGILRSARLCELALGLIAIASFGKLVGCYVGALLGSLTKKEATGLAIGMNARGSTEIVVASIGLSMGVLTEDMYTLVVVMAITTTMITPPLLRWALGRIPLSDAERKEIEKEEAATRELVPNVERVLIAIDDSKNGKLASLLGGLFSGTRDMIATVLPIAATGGSTGNTEIVRSSADVAASKSKDEGATGAESVTEAPDVENRDDIDDVVLLEASKGYDVLFLGAESSRVGLNLEKIIDSFGGASAIAFAGPRPVPAVAAQLNVLVPTIGTDYSQRGAEIAVSIAKGCGGRVTALHIAPDANESFRFHRSRVALEAGRQFVRDVQRLGTREGVTVKTLVRTNRVVEKEIARTAIADKSDVLVIGVKPRRGGEHLWGRRVSALLERAPCAVLLVSS